MANDPKRRLFSRFSLAWTRLFSTSFFAFFLSLHDRAEEKSRTGLFARAKRLFTRYEQLRLKFKRTVPRILEESFFCRMRTRALHFLLSIRLRSFGILFFVFGFANCLIYFARRLWPLLGRAQAAHLIFGLLLTLSALPLFSRRRSLSAALTRSLFVGSFLEKVVLLRADQYPHLHSQSRDAFCALVGLLLGLCCFFTSPAVILLLLCALILCALSLYQPEFATALLFFLYPFLSAPKLVALTLFVALCLLFKVLRGRRSLHVGLLHLCVGIFLLFTLFSGAFSTLPGRENAFFLAGNALSFFLITNLSRKRKVYTVLLASFVCGVTLQSALKLVFYLLPGNLLTGEVRALALALTEHSVPALPLCALILALFFLLRAPHPAGRLWAFLAIGLLLFDLWAESSLAAWGAAVFCMILLLMVSSRALFFGMLALLLGVCIALPLIDGSQTAFLFAALEERAPSLLFSQSQLPQGSFLLGLGAFSPDALTALQLSAEAMPNVTLYTQLLLGLGVYGVLLVALIFVFTFQKSAHYYVSAPHNRHRLLALAPLVCTVALLLCGLTQNLLLTPHVFSLFFAFCSVSDAAVDTLRSDDTVILQRF